MKILLILALILNLTGYGEVDEQGVDTTLTQAVIDPLSGELRMQLEGTLLTDQPLTVTITRSQAGITDEFCCAGQCTFGNREMAETLLFAPKGVASWYVHYVPESDSDTQITYTFSDGIDTLEIQVIYRYSAQGIETITNHQSPITNKKVLQDGHLFIIDHSKKYLLL